MPYEHEALQIERQGWKALSTSGEAAAEFYDEVLAPDVLVLLPGGMLVDDRRQVVDSMRGEPWSSFALYDERVLRLTSDSVAVAYRAEASRGAVEYRALINSTYVRQGGGWRLALHQQTPMT